MCNTSFLDIKGAFRYARRTEQRPVGLYVRNNGMAFSNQTGPYPYSQGLSFSRPCRSRGQEDERPWQRSWPDQTRGMSLTIFHSFPEIPTQIKSIEEKKGSELLCKNGTTNFALTGPTNQREPPSEMVPAKWKHPKSSLTILYFE